MQKTHLISLIFGAVVLVGGAIALVVYQNDGAPETEQTADQDASSGSGESADVTATGGGEESDQAVAVEPEESEVQSPSASETQAATESDGTATQNPESSATANSGDSTQGDAATASTATASDSSGEEAGEDGSASQASTGAETSEETAAAEESGTAPTETQTAAATAGGTADGQDTQDTQDTAGGRKPIAPSFDVVRVERSGDTVLAGRAEPNSTVTVLDNGRPIGSVTADDKGEWVFLPDRPLEPGSRELSLESEDSAGLKVPSEDVVVMSVPEKRTAQSGDAASSGQGEQTSDEPLAVLSPREGTSGASGSQILQAPDSEGIAEGDLVLEAVDYGEDGGITVSGRGAPGSTIRLYLDNELIGETQPDAEGRWSYGVSKEIPFGVYQLRADQVDQDGKVMARVETPFSRVEFARADLPDEKFVIVQPGNSLWRIARGTLGQGVQYTVIYEANADQIRDPDLIYPGQIFVVPQTN